LVTLNDILVEIVGDVPSADEEPQAVQREDGSWLLDGTVDEFLNFRDQRVVESIKAAIRPWVGL